MDLILWRHAEARNALAEEDDALRPLTARGERHAQRIAEWLNQFLPESTRILVSPSLRTRQTADALGRKYRLAEPLGTQASVEELLRLTRWPHSREPVLVVGHQPKLGQVAARLLAGNSAAAQDDGPAWAIRKGAAWWLRHRTRDGQQEVVLVSVRAPDYF